MAGERELNKVAAFRLLKKAKISNTRFSERLAVKKEMRAHTVQRNWRMSGFKRQEKCTKFKPPKKHVASPSGRCKKFTNEQATLLLSPDLETNAVVPM